MSETTDELTKWFSEEELLSIRLAKLCGYTFKDESSRYPDEEEWQKYEAVYRGDGFVGLARPGWTKVPNYATDLNAVAAIEKTLTDEQWKTYFDTLAQITNPYTTEEEKAETCLERYLVRKTRAYVSASAKDRCIALIRTLEGKEGR